MTLSPTHYQANRLDLLSRMAGDISHEIKNPLHAMVINLELVRRKVEKGDGAQAIERVAIIEEEIRKVHDLANALLEALRPPRDAYETCHSGAVLKELAPLVAARARLARVDMRLANDDAHTLLPLPAHEFRLLFLNLADRAVRGAGPGGTVALAARATADGLVLEIEGQNPSLDEAEQAWLQDPPADTDGIDLGLRVVRDMVVRVGGRIAHSAPPGGIHRLTVTLPAASA